MTLLEIMIVIVIIGIVGSVVGYNMRGSLDQGRAFKTKEAARKLYEIILLEDASMPFSSAIDTTSLAHTKDSDAICAIVQEIVQKSKLVRRPKELVRDGWGIFFTFTYDTEKEEVRFSSEKYDAYCAKKGIQTEYPWADEDQKSTLQ